MKIKDKINELENTIKYLKSLDLDSEFEKQLLFTRDSNIKLPELQKIEDIVGSKITKLKFKFAPQIEFLEGIVCDIVIYFKNSNYLRLNYTRCSKIDKDKLLKIAKLFNMDINKPWLDSVLFKNNLSSEKFHDEIRTREISAKFLLSFLSDENINFIKSNNIELGLGDCYDDENIDSLIEMAKDDEFIDTYVVSDT